MSVWPDGYGRRVMTSVDSTLNEATRIASDVAGPEWILALQQTAGRGRRGRSWATPAGNFAAALVLPIVGSPSNAALRSFVASLALFDALVEGGSIRLRPVILTTATTVLGLIPTVYGIGGEDAFVAPLALAFGYGLIFATFITLVLIPVFYHIAEDYKVLVSRIFGKMGISMNPSLYQKIEE